MYGLGDGWMDEWMYFLQHVFNGGVEPARHTPVEEIVSEIEEQNSCFPDNF